MEQTNTNNNEPSISGLTPQEKLELRRKEIRKSLTKSLKEIEESKGILTAPTVNLNNKRKSTTTRSISKKPKLVIDLSKKMRTRSTPLEPKNDYNEMSSEEENVLDHSSEEEGNRKVFKKKKTRNVSKKGPAAVTKDVSEITQAMLNNVCITAEEKAKRRTQIGTTCHQCRQRTEDQKTYCRSGRCRGVRGQFCGYCLSNRYGENIKEVLLNPNWSCPACLNDCNCSICRTHKGLPPTGVLAPYIASHGFTSVRHYLAAIDNGEVDDIFNLVGTRSVESTDSNDETTSD